MQLDSLSIQPGETSLREQLVEYLQTHPYTHEGSSHFREYTPAPVVSDDPSNADTEAPSEQDEFISFKRIMPIKECKRFTSLLPKSDV